MKANRIRQINGFFNMGIFEVIKLFFVYCLMNNPIFYYGFFPTPKNAYHNSIFSFYPYSQNLRAIGIQFFKLFYIDFSANNHSIVIFVSINCHSYYFKKLFFINYKGNFKTNIFTLKGFKSWTSILKNNHGFISIDILNPISLWFFRIVMAFLIALVLSLHDIDISSYQEYTNDIQYAFKSLDYIITK